MGFNEFLSWAVAALVLGILGYITQQALPSVKAWLKSRMTEKDIEILDQIFRDIVKTVEYERLKSAAEGIAFDALEYGLMLADLYLQRYGIDLDEKLILALLKKYLSNSIESEKWDAESSTEKGIVFAVEKTRYWA